MWLGATNRSITTSAPPPTPGTLASDPFPRTRWQVIQPGNYNNSTFQTNAAKFNIVDFGPYMGIEHDQGETFQNIFQSIKSQSTANGFATPTRCLHYIDQYAQWNGTSPPGTGAGGNTFTVWTSMVNNAGGGNSWWIKGSPNGYPTGPLVASVFGQVNTSVLAQTSQNAVLDSSNRTLAQAFWFHFDGALRLGQGVSLGYSSGVSLATNTLLDGYQLDNWFCQTRNAGSYGMNSTVYASRDTTADAFNQQGQAALITVIKAVNPNLLIMPNADYFAHSTGVFDNLVTLDNSNKGIMDMVYCQNFIGGTGIEGFGTTLQMMQAGIAAEAQMLSTGTLIFEQTGATNSNGFSSASQASWTSVDWQAARFGLACSCMRNWHYELNNLENYSANNPYFMDEYLIQGGKYGWLGQPIDAPQSASRTQGVWYRQFQGGVVFMNPAGNGTQTINLTALGLNGLSTLTSRGFGDTSINPVTPVAVTSITLQARDGRFLI